jgi:ATP-dependent DNA ligase
MLSRLRRRGTNWLEALPRRKAEFIEPMECALVSKLPEGPDWTYEVKLDGYRAIGVRTSRDTKRYPYIPEALGDLLPDTVVDGEVVALDDFGRPDFHRLQHYGAEAKFVPFLCVFQN